MTNFDPTALHLLRVLTGNSKADFRPGQLEAIQAVARDRDRALVVQRTGWGKSAVYFISTRMLRDQGLGPTVIVSPLLALMRNQLEMADRLGLNAHTIDSTNRDSWEPVSLRRPQTESCRVQLGVLEEPRPAAEDAVLLLSAAAPAGLQDLVGLLQGRKILVVLPIVDLKHWCCIT